MEVQRKANWSELIWNKKKSIINIIFNLLLIKPPKLNSSLRISRKIVRIKKIYNLLFSSPKAIIIIKNVCKCILKRKKQITPKMSNNRNHSYIYNVSMKDHTFWQHWRQEHILQLPQNYGKSCFHKPLPVCEHSGWYYIIAKVKKKIIIYIAMIQIWFRTHITCTLYYW